MDEASPQLRLGIIGVIILSMFGALFARVWHLQVMAADDYQQVTVENRLRVIHEEAPRGRILDLRGRVVVDNRTSLVITVDKKALAELEAVQRDALVLRLASELTEFGIPTKVARIERRLADPQFSPLEPVPVAVDVPADLEVYLAEHAEAFPAVAVRRESVRAYPHGTLAAHLVGYVGRISPEEFTARMGTTDEPVEGVAKPYQLASNIGKTGVERVYEDDLRGTPGRRTVEVDSAGRIVRTVERVAPVPGNDLQLTIDLDVQANVEAQLARQLEGVRGTFTRDGKLRRTPAGAVVSIDPRDGGVLAIASYPTYDPAEFVNGISVERFERLNTADPTRNPLTDRAIGGQYAPGSTFKLFTAHAALVAGIVEPSTPYNDIGVYTIQGCTGSACERQNAGRQGTGIVDLPRSLTVSSDTYYYRLGDMFHRESGRLGDGIQTSARLFGLGETTGLGLPGEGAGAIPDAAWKRALFDAMPPEQQANGDPTWYAGDNVNLAIGQGDVLATPLQMANAYAAFANGGTVFEPRVVARVLRAGADPADPTSTVRIVEPVVRRSIEFPPGAHAAIERGLAGVTTDPKGTAETAFAGWDHDEWPVASKTGTAEVRGKADTAIYVAYGPVGAPEVVTFALLEEAGFGGEVAAPLVRRVLAPLAGQPARAGEDESLTSSGGAVD